MVQIFGPSASSVAITTGSHTHQTGRAKIILMRKTGIARLTLADPAMVNQRAKSRLKRASPSSRQANDRPIRLPTLIAVLQEDVSTLHLDLSARNLPQRP
jgi:hypothetical protein